MITMYSAVANRTAEIGTLRALGFRRRNILLAFLTESLLLGFIGGCHRIVLRVVHAVYHDLHGKLSDVFRTGV